MRHSSKLGCLIYQDSVLGEQSLCEPTMLFLLGVESILSPDKITDRFLYFNRNDIGELFNDIYKYLYVTDQDPSTDSIEYDCNGVKIFLNTLMGTGHDRIMPIIFHDDNDAECLGFTQETTYDEKSARLVDILNDAGYCEPAGTVKVISKYGITDQSLIDQIDTANRSYIDEHNSRIANSQIYKLFDYKAMYSYALGVLYGCVCLGADEALLWRVSPSIWYYGDYFNLVNTAWSTFRLHYAHPIKRIDSDIRLACKYKGIQFNKLFNFDNSQFNIMQDELLCYSTYIEDGNLITVPIMYSESINSYLLLENSATWSTLDESVISEEFGRGIIADSEEMITFDKDGTTFEMKRAFRLSDGTYLSPSADKEYFIYTNNLGWSTDPRIN